MGAALNDSRAILSGIVSSGPPGDNQVILLITDGENNQSPLNLLDPAVNPGQWIKNAANKIRVYSIGIGNEKGAFYQTLNDISSATGGSLYAFFDASPYTGPGTGIYWKTTGGMTPAKTLANALDDWLASFLNYQGITDPSGEIPAGKIVEDTLTVTPLDKGLLYAIHWNTRHAGVPSVRIIFEDSTLIDANETRLTNEYRVRRGRDFVYFWASDSLIQKHYGNWRLQLDGSRVPTTIQYTYSIHTQSDLALATGFQGKLFATGDSLKGQLQVELSGTKINGARGEVLLRAPENWLGNWNAAQRLTPAELDSLRRGNWENDFTSLEKKMAYLAQNKKINFPRQIAILPRKALIEKNSSYGNTFVEELKTPGIYEVHFRLSGTVNGHPFKRDLYFHKYVAIALDTTWDHSKIEFERLSRDGNFIRANIRLTFKDKYDNVELPDLANKITITADRGTLDDELIDNIDGSYTKRITYDERLGRPIISVKHSGKTFPVREVKYEEDNIYIVAFAGYFKFDKGLPIQDNAIFGVRIGKQISPPVYLEFEGGVAPTRDASHHSGVVIHANLNLMRYLNTTARIRNFFTAGAGLLSFKDFSSEATGFAANLGYGVNVRTSSWLDLRFDLRDFVGFNLYGKKVSHNIQTTFAFQWKL